MKIGLGFNEIELEIDRVLRQQIARHTKIQNEIMCALFRPLLPSKIFAHLFHGCWIQYILYYTVKNKRYILRI